MRGVGPPRVVCSLLLLLLPVSVPRVQLPPLSSTQRQAGPRLFFSSSSSACCVELGVVDGMDALGWRESSIEVGGRVMMMMMKTEEGQFSQTI
jgi:hypothetical protein